MSLMCLSLVLLSLLELNTPLIYVIIALLMLGVGMGLFSAPNTSAVMGSVDARQLGVASGTLSTMRFVGQSLSLAFMGAFAATVIPPDLLQAIFGGIISEKTVSAEAFLRGENIAFTAGAVLAACGVITSMVRGAQKRQNKKVGA